MDKSLNGITIKPDTFKKIEKTSSVIHLVFIATKPDIIKQAPLILELKKEGEAVFVVHSGQHYDWRLSGGLEQEFGIEPDFNLNVKGTLYQQQSQIIQKSGIILEKLRKMGKVVVPYTYGDTTTALAAGIASYLNKYAVAHVEAGLRTMTPPRKLYLSLLHNFDVEDYYEELKNISGWKKGSYEPFPEQFDTRAAAPSAGVHLAPTLLNEKHLLDEGYSSRRIFTVGNPVVDAIRIMEKKAKESKIFEEYPVLEKGNVIRFCIHRRENVSSYHRFKTIFAAMRSLIQKGERVLLISLGGTERSFQEFKLKEEVDKLAKKHKNFVYSPVWPYYHDVIAAMKKCSVIPTDSGSIQEETNILGIPGVVLRFNTDRPEAVFAGTNTIAPPLKAEAIEKIILGVHTNESLRRKMHSVPNLYGENVSKKICEIVKTVTKREKLFELFEHEQLGFDKLPFWEKGELDW